MSTKLQHEFGPAMIKPCRKEDQIQRFKNGYQLPIRRKLGEVQSSHRPGQQWLHRQHRKKLRKAEDKKRSTETLGTSQPSKTVNLNTTPTAMDLGDVVPSFGRPSRAAAMTALDAQLKNVANRDDRDEKALKASTAPMEWTTSELSLS